MCFCFYGNQQTTNPNRSPKKIHPHSKTSSPGSYQGPAIPSRILDLPSPKKKVGTEATNQELRIPRTKSQTFFHLIAASSWRVFLDRGWTGRLVKFFGSLVGWLRARLPRKRFLESLSVGKKILHRSSVVIGASSFSNIFVNLDYFPPNKGKTQMNLKKKTLKPRPTDYDMFQIVQDHPKPSCMQWYNLRSEIKCLVLLLGARIGSGTNLNPQIDHWIKCLKNDGSKTTFLLGW